MADIRDVTDWELVTTMLARLGYTCAVSRRGKTEPGEKQIFEYFYREDGTRMLEVGQHPAIQFDERNPVKSVQFHFVGYNFRPRYLLDEDADLLRRCLNCVLPNDLQKDILNYLEKKRCSGKESAKP